MPKACSAASSIGYYMARHSICDFQECQQFIYSSKYVHYLLMSITTDLFLVGHEGNSVSTAKLFMDIGKVGIPFFFFFFCSLYPCPKLTNSHVCLVLLDNKR